jgi:hypothetical protein
MFLRNGMLGLMILSSVGGTVGAEPPINPLVEGREPNPVAREFYEPDPVVYEYVAVEEEAVGAGWWASRAAWETLFNRLTMPLGNVQLWD